MSKGNAVVPLDAIDRTILASLQEDGRITNVDLARRAGLTAPPCLRRVRALEEAGVIESYHARLDSAALGYGIMVFALVSLKSQAETDLRAFEAHVASLPEIRECHMLNGERRDRFHPEDRRPRPAELPVVPDLEADPGAQRRQREDFAHHPHVKGRAGHSRRPALSAPSHQGRSARPTVRSMPCRDRSSNISPVPRASR
jgi:DNA-binding Lrp family transcriptional regulator